MTDPKPPGEGGEPQDEKWYERTRYQALLFAGGIVLFGLVLWFVLDSYIDPKTSAQKKDLVQVLGLITAGVAGAVGIFFTWRGQRITQRDQERNQRNTQEQIRLTRQSQEDNQRNTQAQLEQSRNELDITRRGQITERFTQAIDQLGIESLEIRLGGIYSLERTAREDRDYHWPIMEVLTTYVRTQTQELDESRVSPSPKPDIQAILTVIGRRSVYDRGVEYGTIDLHATHLRGANLQRANLQGANLQGADLALADLQEADLHGADLSRADIVTDFTIMEHNRGERLGGVLKIAKLRNANLQRANLQGADLRGADLWKADLSAADLSAANLSEADLSAANLSEANLSGADLSNAENLTKVQLEDAIVDGMTKLPSHLKEG